MSDESRACCTQGRRSFLKGLLLSVIGLTGLSFAGPIFKYIIPKRGKAEGNYLTTADGKPISAASIRDGESMVGLSQEGPAILIRRAGKITAFSAVCTHLGCLVKWMPNEGTFFCPCHAGKFDANGVNISGPPPTPLTAYAVETDSESRIMLKKI